MNAARTTIYPVLIGPTAYCWATRIFVPPCGIMLEHLSIDPPNERKIRNFERYRRQYERRASRR